MLCAFCFAVYNVYNGQISPKIAVLVSRCYRGCQYDKVVKLAHFVCFVLKFTGKEACLV